MEKLKEFYCKKVEAGKMQCKKQCNSCKKFKVIDPGKGLNVFQ